MSENATTDTKFTIDSKDLTQPEAEQTGTTSPDTGSSGATQADAEQGGTFDQEAVEKIVRNRLARERKKWEQEREEAEEQARMTEAEKLQRDLAKKDDQISTLQAEVDGLRRREQLIGKVRDPRAAMKLVEDEHLDEDGNVDVDKLLEAFPFLALEETAKPSARSATSPTPATGGPARNPFAKDSLNLTEQARLLRENPSLADTLRKQAGS